MWTHNFDVDVSDIFREFAAKIGGYNKMVDKDTFLQMKETLALSWRKRPFRTQLDTRTLLFDKKRKLITNLYKTSGYRYCVLLEKRMRFDSPDVQFGKVRFADGTFLELGMIGNYFVLHYFFTLFSRRLPSHIKKEMSISPPVPTLDNKPPAPADLDDDSSMSENDARDTTADDAAVNALAQLLEVRRKWKAYQKQLADLKAEHARVEKESESKIMLEEQRLSTLTNALNKSLLV